MKQAILTGYQISAHIYGPITSTISGDWKQRFETYTQIDMYLAKHPECTVAATEEVEVWEFPQD